ncbi:MAG: RDD family protein [Bacteroidia bacterium]|nr:RDD family protein [Bacteroidia bacterium]
MSTLAPTYESIRIETPENISFDYELAGPGTRMVAYLIDYLIIMVSLGSVSAVLLFIESKFSGLSSIINALHIAIWGILFGLGGYFTLFEFFNNGQTPGKRTMGIRVIQANGTSLRLVPGILRNIIRLIDCFPPFQFAIGSVALIFSDHVQRFGDMLSGTIVVKEKKEEKAERFRYKARVTQTGKSIQLNLIREEFDFITGYAAVYKTLEATHRNKIATQVIRPIIDRNRLGSDPFFSPLVADFESAPNSSKYVPAEAILKEILRFYLTENVTAPK